jgi:anti-sigma factor RsiW
MIETNHVLNQVSDYVLGLLPSGESRRVEQHVALCRECRQAIRRERQIGTTIRSSIARIPQPGRRRFQELMPPAPSRRQIRWRIAWQKQLAPVFLGLIVLLGSWGLWQTGRNSDWTRSRDDWMVVTATMTDVPTATLAQTETAHSGRSFITLATLVPVSYDVAAAPAPKPTPIAAATQEVADQ